MKDLYIAFWILEGFLFFGWIIFFFGGRKIRQEEKRVGFVLFVAWLAVLVAGALWGIFRMILKTLT